MNQDNNNQYKANQNIQNTKVNNQPQQPINNTTQTQQSTNVQPQQNIKNQKVDVPKKEKSNNALVIFVFILIGAFILALPTITSFIQHRINLNPKIDHTSNSGLVNGYIQVGKESNMTLSYIKFYNFQKVPNTNNITFNYISSRIIEDVNNENLYIEFYNNTEKLVYRKKFNIGKINKNEVKQYSFQLEENVFPLVFYAKVIKITDEELNKGNEVVYECTFDLIENEVNFLYNIKYYFKNSELIKYDVNKNLLGDVENETMVNAIEDLNEEYNLVKATNVKNINKENQILSYTIDFKDFDSMDSGFKPLFNRSAIKYIIENYYKDSEWNCN